MAQMSEVEFSEQTQVWRDLAETDRFLADTPALEDEWSELKGALEAPGVEVPRAQRGVYNRRLKDVQAELIQRYRVLDILKAGYDECFIPGDYTVGFVEPPSAARLHDWGVHGTFLLFNAPIPPAHLERYKRAKASGLFDAIVVASADQSLFRVYAPRPTRPKGLYVDPLMIGLIGLPSLFETPLRIGSKGSAVSGGRAYLITQWDLSKDMNSG